MKPNPKRVDLIDGQSRVYDRVSYKAGWLLGFIDAGPGEENGIEALPIWRVTEVVSIEPTEVPK